MGNGGATVAGTRFAGPAFLPPPADVGAWLEPLSRFAGERAAASASGVLSAFMGWELPAEAFHLSRIDHVAVYLGDYRREEEVEVFLARLAAAPGVAELASGPSHIAPRFWETPGYWISLRLDGVPLEIFTCRHRAPWRARPIEERRALMSHDALAVEDASHVEPLLAYLAHYPGIERLCFSASDALGHIYGHLLAHAAARVLELVYDPAKGAPP